MALPSSGAISLAQVNVELGKASDAAISMNDAAVRGLFGVAIGVISMSNGYGKSNGPTLAFLNAAGEPNSYPVAAASSYYDYEYSPSITFHNNGKISCLDFKHHGQDRFLNPITPGYGTHLEIKFVGNIADAEINGATIIASETPWLSLANDVEISTLVYNKVTEGTVYIRNKVTLQQVSVGFSLTWLQ